MAREWSRRSIEELVRGYMRRHTPPSSGSSCEGADYIVVSTPIPKLYDAAGQELGLPLYKLEAVMASNSATQVPNEMRVIRFGENPPIHFKNQYNRHIWVIGLFALYGMSVGGWPVNLDLYDEAGGLVTTVYTGPSSMLLNAFSSILIPNKLEITKRPEDPWKNFPGCFYGNESVTFVLLYTVSKNETNPLPEGWNKRVAFYKSRSPYE